MRKTSKLVFTIFGLAAMVLLGVASCSITGTTAHDAPDKIKFTTPDQGDDGTPSTNPNKQLPHYPHHPTTPNDPSSVGVSPDTPPPAGPNQIKKI